MKRFCGCVILMSCILTFGAELEVVASVTPSVQRNSDQYFPIELIEKFAKTPPAVPKPKKRAEVTPPDINKLIDELGASDHKTRESAGEELFRIGKPAEEWLERAAASDDPEISIRAGALLKTIKSGIHHSFSADLKKRLLNYQNLSSKDKFRAIDYIYRTHQKEGMSFLLDRMVRGNEREAEYIVNKFKSQKKHKEETLKLIMKHLQAPSNKHQADLLTFVSIKIGKMDEMVKALTSDHLSENNRSLLTGKCVKQLIHLVLNFEYKLVKEYAEKCITAVPSDARFVYIFVAVFEAERNVRDADKFSKLALAMNKNSESHHYQAGDLLMNLGLYRRASLEWEKILTIPPQGDVYDINAHFRLGQIYQHSKMYGKAAEKYEEGVREYQEAREVSTNIGITTGVDSVNKNIQKLRKQMVEEEQADNAEIKDHRGIMNIVISSETITKDGKQAELDKAKAKALVAMGVNVQPYGFRIFETAKAVAKYDPEKKHINILMNGSPTTKPYSCNIRSEKATVAVQSLDMLYIYKVNGITGETVLAETYESDYIIRVGLGPAIRDLTDMTITMNKQKHTRDEFIEGVKIDYLPKKFEIHVKGLTEEGEKTEIHRSVAAKDVGSYKSNIEGPVAVKIEIEISN